MESESLQLDIALLGPLQVRLQGEIAAFRTDAERALLTYLALHQGQPQRRDTLAGLLSPDRPDEEALTYLRNRLTRLRSALADAAATPPWLSADRKQILLRTGADIRVDSTRFRDLLAAVEHHAHRQLAGCPICLAHLDEAVGLVRGEVLAGLHLASDSWDTWLAAQRAYYGQRTLAAMTLLRDARLARGEWAAALDIARRQLRLEPWLESAHRAIMTAYTRCGDRTAALAQFRLCVRTLQDELGVEPEAATGQLHRQIASGTDLLVRGADRVGNLPLPAGGFVGREPEQALLSERLVDPRCRLLTIVGAGGMGKTRLATEVGAQVQASFPDGVWIVALDALSGGAEQIALAVGEAAGLAQDGRQLNGDQVLAMLRDRHALLIFDGCESVLDDLAFLPVWLRRAPHIAVLATSREPLNFAAESVVLLGGLPIGTGASGAAEQLFAAHGRMARDDFALSDANLPHVHQICALVDGSPLGIALAAAWVRRRSLAQIHAEISRSLDLLSTRMRDIDPRHRSMRAVFEASWRLLGSAERAVLAALSVVPASFTAAAAHALAGASQHDLDVLCEKSLLGQQVEPERYRLHSLLRQFAAEKLADRTPIIDRACVSYYAEFARAPRSSYADLQHEWPNLAAAIAKAHRLALWRELLGIVQALDEAWFRQIRFADMRDALTCALDAARALQDAPLYAATLLRLGQVDMEQGQYAAAEQHISAAMAHFTQLEDGPGIAHSTYCLSRIRLEQGQDAAALALRARQLSEAEGDWLGVARALNLLANCHMLQRPDWAVAQAYLEQSVAIQRQLPPSPTYVEALRYLARVASVGRDFTTAEHALHEATTVSQSLQDMGEYAAVLFDRMVLRRRQQQLDMALTDGYASLELLQKLGSLRWEALAKTQLAIVHQTKQQHEQALTFFRDGLQVFAELGDTYEQAYSHYYLSDAYTSVGDREQSAYHKQQALDLNRTLHNDHLAGLLAADRTA